MSLINKQIDELRAYAKDRKGERMFEVPYGQDPYSAIGKYIRENITAIEDIIAVIDINGVETNELFLVDMEEDGFFVWKSDWYEGEKKVVLIDFFPVSEAINSSAQPDVPDTNVGDTIYRETAIDAIKKSRFLVDAMEKVIKPPPAQPERKTGHWERHNTYYGDDVSGSIDPDWRCSECGGKANVNEFFMYDLTDFCPNCGADMRGEEK